MNKSRQIESWENAKEFIQLIWWAFFPPEVSRLMSGYPPLQTREEISKVVTTPLPRGKRYWIDELRSALNRESQRVQTIEQKASTLLGQNALVVTLLTIGTTILLKDAPATMSKLMVMGILLFDFIILVCFVCAILWARNAVRLHFEFPYPEYSKSNIEFVKSLDDKEHELVKDLIYSIERWSYNADVKATCVRIAHDFLRIGFALLVLLIGGCILMLVGNEIPLECMISWILKIVQEISLRISTLV